MTEPDSKPVCPPARDGVYPRCVWCNGANWALAVLAYSTRACTCAAVPPCGRYLPEDYVKRTACEIKELVEP